MSMSKYRTAPREGHLERVQRIYGYVCKYRHYKIRYQIDEPNYTNVPEIPDHDWEHSFYGNMKKILQKMQLNH